MRIRLEHVSRNYGALHAVEDVSLEIPSNEVFGVIGRSGAGKSTLVRLISLLERPDSGEIYYDDRRVDNLPKKDLIQERRKIGMIFQNFNLFSSRTALENIEYPMEICHMDRKIIKERAKELLSLVGLEGRGDAAISTLSGGQKQRIAIARALAVDPNILFCDEATSALDPQTTRSILALIKEIQKKMNLTVVMITHQMEVVRDACTSVAVLEQGKIVERGDAKEVFASPQTAVTKDFLSNISNIKNSVIRWSKEGGHYTLRFRGTTTEEPIISEVAKRTGAVFNIRAAGVNIVDNEEQGIMILDIGPDSDVAKDAVDTFESLGVKVEEERNGDIH